MMYDSGSWSWGPTLPYRCKLPGAVQIDDHLFVVFGGFHNGEKKSAYSYDFETDMWIQLPNMPFGGYYSSEQIFTDKNYQNHPF